MMKFINNRFISPSAHYLSSWICLTEEKNKKDNRKPMSSEQKFCYFIFNLEIKFVIVQGEKNQLFYGCI